MIATLRKFVKVETKSLLENEALNNSNFEKSCEDIDEVPD